MVRGGGSSPRCSSRRWRCWRRAAWRGWPGRAGGPTRLWAAATVAAVVPAAGWVVAALAAADTRCRPDRGPRAAGNAGGGRVPGGCADRGDAGDRPCVGRRRAAARHAGSAGVAGTGAAHRAQARSATSCREVPVDEVAVGDLVVVGPGEVLPVDGLVEAGPAVLDESALTGEPELVERAVGEPVRSGTLNAGGAIEVRCSVPAAQSTYAGIIALVRQAGAESAPVIRLADRFAAWFLPLSLAAGRAGVVGEWVGRTRGGRAGGRHAVSVAAGRAGGDRLRAVARLAARGGRAQRWRVGEPRPGPDDGAGQDRHPHGRATRGDRSGRRAGPPGRRGAADGRLGRPAVPARARRGGGRRGAQARAGAVVAGRGRGGAGPRRHRRGRRRPGAGGQTGRGTGRCVGARGAQPGRAGRLRAGVGRGRRRSRSAPSCSRTRCGSTRAAPCGGCAPPVSGAW